MGQTDEKVGSILQPTAVRYQVLAVACSVAVLAYVHRLGFASAVPELQADLRLSDSDTGYLMAAFLFAYGAFEIPGGVLSDRLGVRHVLTLAVGGWSLLTGALALVLWLPSHAGIQLCFLLALRFLFGMFQAVAFPALARMMTDWMPVTERATAQGFIWMSTRLGGAVIPLLLVPMFQYFGDWQTPVWIVASIGVVWCAGFWPWFRNRPEEMPRVSEAERDLIAAGRAPAAEHSHVPWRQILTSRSVWCLCLMYGFFGFAANFFVTLLPAYLKTHRHIPDTERMWLTSLPMIFGIVACVLGGLLSDWFIRWTGNRKWGRRLNGAIGLLIAATAYLSTIWVESTAALGLLLCVTFFFNDLNMAPAWAACADIGERYAGTVGGAMNMAGNIFGAVAALLTGYLLGIGQTSLVFVVLAGGYVLASLCWLGVDVTQPLSAESDSVHGRT